LLHDAGTYPLPQDEVPARRGRIVVNVTVSGGTSRALKPVAGRRPRRRGCASLRARPSALLRNIWPESSYLRRKASPTLRTSSGRRRSRPRSRPRQTMPTSFRPTWAH
jgi:hypothetical protein